MTGSRVVPREGEGAGQISTALRSGTVAPPLFSRAQDQRKSWSEADGPSPEVSREIAEEVRPKFGIVDSGDVNLEQLPRTSTRRTG